MFRERLRQVRPVDTCVLHGRSNMFAGESCFFPVKAGTARYLPLQSHPILNICTTGGCDIDDAVFTRFFGNIDHAAHKRLGSLLDSALQVGDEWLGFVSEKDRHIRFP